MREQSVQIKPQLVSIKLLSGSRTCHNNVPNIIKESEY